MTIKQLKERAEQNPFRPFSIETVGGRQIAVFEASDVFFPKRRPELIIVFEDTGAMTILEADSVASLSVI
jgi:hypothetical protein